MQENILKPNSMRKETTVINIRYRNLDKEIM